MKKGSSAWNGYDSCVLIVTVLLFVPLVFPKVFSSNRNLGSAALFGWVIYPPRPLGKARFDWEGIAVFLITLAAITLLGHYLLHRFFGLSKSDRPTAPARPGRRSLLLLASVIVFLMLGVFAASIYHHVIFLATYTPQAPVQKFKQYHPENTMSNMWISVIIDPNDSSGRYDPRIRFRNFAQAIPAYMEQVQTGFFPTQSGSFYAAVITPRDPSDLAEYGFVVVKDSMLDAPKTHPASEWPAILDTLRAEAAAFVAPNATPGGTPGTNSQ